MTPTQAPRIITDAASAPATPIVEPQVNPNTLSPRQRGRQFLDAFLPRSRSRSSSASSRQSRSPDSVKDVIANLGLAAGTIGSEQIQQKSIHEEAIQGAKAFLSSIHNIIKRQGTGLENCVETIEVCFATRQYCNARLTESTGSR